MKGSEVNHYYAVAVARRRDSFLTLFNLKRKSVDTAYRLLTFYNNNGLLDKIFLCFAEMIHQNFDVM